MTTSENDVQRMCIHSMNGTTIIHFFTEGENDTEDLDMNSYVEIDIDLDTDEGESCEVEEVQHVEEVWETENRADLMMMCMTIVV